MLSPRRCPPMTERLYFLVGLLGCILVLLTYCSCCHSRCGESAAPGGQPHRLALLIGITRYADHVYPRKAPYLRNLTGAEDVALLKRVLTQPPWSLPPRDVITMSDEGATRDNIVRAFESLAKRAQPGDAVLAYLGGHGMAIPDDNGDELDGTDESFVPWDYISDDARLGAETNLRDDRLGTLLAGLRGAVGSSGSVTMILDSCHSGTGTRAIAPVRGRGWSVTLDGRHPPPSSMGRPKDASGLFTLGQPEREGFAVISAAAAEEEANPAYIRQFEAMHGALTGELAVVMSRHGPGVSFRTLFDQLSAQVAADVRTGASQHPQLVGVPVDRTFFSRSGPRGMPHLTVTTVLPDAKSVELPIGRAHGATVGSRFGFYRPCAETGSSPLAEGEVEDVQAFSSRVRIAEKYVPVTDLAALKAAWAVEKSHRFELQPLVLLLPAGVTLPQSLASVGFISTTASDKNLFDFRLLHTDGRWILERLDGSRAAEIADGPGAHAKLKQVLLSLWRWAYLARLESPGTAPLAPSQVRVVALDAAPPSSATSAPGVVGAFVEGSAVTIELQQTPPADGANGFVWISLLQLGPDGSITPIYPAADDVAGNRLLADGKPHRLPLPDYTFRVETPGRYFLKAIATTVPVDFTPIISAAERADRDVTLTRAPTELSALAVLLSANGDADIQQMRVPLLTWSTTQIAFDVVVAGPRH